MLLEVESADPAAWLKIVENRGGDLRGAGRGGSGGAAARAEGGAAHQAAAHREQGGEGLPCGRRDLSRHDRSRVSEALSLTVASCRGSPQRRRSPPPPSPASLHYCRRSHSTSVSARAATSAPTPTTSTFPIHGFRRRHHRRRRLRRHAGPRRRRTAAGRSGRPCGCQGGQPPLPERRPWYFSDTTASARAAEPGVAAWASRPASGTTTVGPTSSCRTTAAATRSCATPARASRTSPPPKA